MSIFGGALLHGIIETVNGHDFGKTFNDYITDNWAQTVAITSLMFIATLAITVIANPTALCFKEGTLVETEDGLKPIEEIKEGDFVLAFDENTGEQAFKPVVQLFRNTTDNWYHIIANGEEIICTAEHPFFVVGLGFVPAKNLSISDKLLSSDNAVIEIDSITIETLSTPETTYNFEVADFHTYYVGDNGVLVHNTCKEWPPRRRKYWKQEAEELKGAGITYDNTTDNINRMKKGLAPRGFDGRSVELHHVKGIKNDIDYVVQIQRSDHIRFHKTYGYRDFIDITLAEDFIGLFV